MLNHFWNKNVKKVEELVESGENFNILLKSDRNFCVPVSPLIVAVEQDHFEMIKLLVEKGNADVNFAIEMGKTPIFSAKSVQVAQYLVEQGANLDIVCKVDKYNALSLHLQMKRLDVAEYLISLGQLPIHWSPYLNKDTILKHLELFKKHEKTSDVISKQLELLKIHEVAFDELIASYLKDPKS
jgi:ankyrin repeat protein